MAPADIRRAEREVTAPTARIGMATADLFPRHSLDRAPGLQSVAASDFFTGGSRFFALGAAIHWPIGAGALAYRQTGPAALSSRSRRRYIS